MRPRLKDIAEKAGVSTATVSMILNQKTERISRATIESVLSIANDLDYTPNIQAQALKGKGSNLIALLIPDITNAFYSEIAQGAARAAITEGYMLSSITLPTDAHEVENIRRIFKSGYFAGALIVSRKFDHLREELLKAMNLDYVLLDESYDLSGIGSIVKADNELGGRKVGEYLLEMGHRKFACITGPEESLNSIRRLSGFKNALKAANCQLSEDHILVGDYTIEGGYKAAKFLDGLDFTAVFALNDLMAMGTIKRLKEMGYAIPDDISVVGYDNISTGDFLSPRLTTVDQHAHRIGVEGFNVLNKILNKEERSDELIITPTFVEKDSVKNINRQK